MKKDIYKGKKYLQFEDEEFCVPYYYEEVLKTIYGNYMELPPVEKRGGHHFFKAYREIN